MFIDSHCHLDFPDFDSDRAEVIARARAAGVVAFINPGCTIARSRRAVEIARHHSDVYAAVGIHPHDAATLTDETIDEFTQLAADTHVVAIGEIGLDYFRIAEEVEQTIEIQKNAFHRQLTLAQTLHLPVILHTREAEADTLAILDAFPDVRGVAHCYTGSRETADALIARGWMIGFTGIITFKNADALREVVRAVPLERMLIETDAPYLAPEPHRGGRAEPAYVALVAAMIAAIKNVSVEEVGDVTTRNAKALFSLV